MDKEKVIEFLEDMIDTLTFRRVALLTLLISITILLLTIFEHRSAVFTMLYKKSEAVTSISWDLSNESKSELQSLTVSTQGLVGAVVLMDVDLKKNRRKPKYFYIQDQAVMSMASPIISKMLSQALFDFDHKNTEQMVAMLNNEYKCVPTIDTQNTRFFPELVSKYPVTCRIAVPPFFGEYAGFLTSFLVREPTESEHNALKIEMNRMAIELYLRDISKSLKIRSDF